MTRAILRKIPFLVLFLLLTLTALWLLAGKEWPGVAFTEVRAYAWPNDETTQAVILPDMSLKPGVINKEGALLTPEQVKKLVAAVTGKHPDYSVAACHIPHNAFVFYDAEKKPVAFVEVCFHCRGVRMAPAGSSPKKDLVSMASIFAEHKLPMGKYPDLAAFEKEFKGVTRPEKSK